MKIALEANVLNMALFGKKAAQWRSEKGIKGKTPNIRDFASAEELVVLINLKDTNADLIGQNVPKIERLKILREKAYQQLEILKKNQETIQVLKRNLIEDIGKDNQKTDILNAFIILTIEKISEKIDNVINSLGEEVGLYEG